jgi:diguanylate cyclase (GGDEF)-like protein
MIRAKTNSRRHDKKMRKTYVYLLTSILFLISQLFLKTEVLKTSVIVFFITYVYWVLCMYDNEITHLKKQNHDLNILCHIDSLTGLYNHRKFDEVFQAAFDRAKKEDIPLSLLFLDVNNLKETNDTFGHLKGDQLLQDVARVIKESIREDDKAFRYGGDEFCVILETDKEQTQRILKRVLYNMEVAGLKGRVVVGSATYPQDGETPEEIFMKADKAMYRRKIQRRRASTLLEKSRG